MQTNLINHRTNEIKNVKVGFSLTVFFWGFFPALFRGDWKWLAIMIVSNILVGSITWGFGCWLVSLVFSFIYNKIYVTDLMNQGFEPIDESAANILLSKGYITNSNQFHH